MQQTTADKQTKAGAGWRQLVCPRCGQVVGTVNAKLVTARALCPECKRWVQGVRVADNGRK